MSLVRAPERERSLCLFTWRWSEHPEERIEGMLATFYATAPRTGTTSAIVFVLSELQCDEQLLGRNPGLS